MIGYEELQEALEKVKDMQWDTDLPWSKFVESMGFDPGAILDIAADHRETMEKYHMFDSEISFGSGFTLALIVMSMQSEKAE